MEKLEQLRPLGNGVLAELIPAPVKSEGGIIMPDNARGQTNKAKILKVGSGVKESLMVGDVVLFVSCSGVVPVEGKNLIMLLEEEIMAVVEQGDAVA
jgi:chaperonin GroES